MASKAFRQTRGFIRAALGKVCALWAEAGLRLCPRGGDSGHGALGATTPVNGGRAGKKQAADTPGHVCHRHSDTQQVPEGGPSARGFSQTSKIKRERMKMRGSLGRRHGGQETSLGATYPGDKQGSYQWGHHEPQGPPSGVRGHVQSPKDPKGRQTTLDVAPQCPQFSSVSPPDTESQMAATYSAANTTCVLPHRGML